MLPRDDALLPHAFAPRRTDRGRRRIEPAPRSSLHPASCRRHHSEWVPGQNREQLRHAADLELPDASFLPDDGDEETLREQVEARWWDQGDRTAYGLVNAVSGVARDLEGFRQQLALEELAGVLV